MAGLQELERDLALRRFGARRSRAEGEEAESAEGGGCFWV
jgi:hypothetical protein